MCLRTPHVDARYGTMTAENVGMCRIGVSNRDRTVGRASGSVARGTLRSMRRLRRHSAALLVVALLAAATISGCGTDQPLQVTTIQLGRSINPDKTVASHTTRFKPTDTIYAAVLTDGTGPAKIKVRWRYRGTLVSEPEQDVKYQGPAATEFHLENSGGFPPGDYTVEFFVDGKPIGTRPFKIESDKKNGR